MKKFALLAALIAGIVPASAADLSKAAPIQKAPVAYVPTADPFTGIYIGAHFGRGFDESGDSAFAIVPISGLQAAPQGFLGGLQAGLGTRFGNGMFYGGIETDITIANLRGSSSDPSSGLITANSKDDWLGSTRGRFGFFPLQNLMLYGTAGVAYGDPSASFTFSTAPAPTTVNASNTKIGWVAGAGVEAALNANWLVRAEWLRYDLGKATETDSAAGISIVAPFQVDVFRGGLSYKF